MRKRLFERAAFFDARYSPQPTMQKIADLCETKLIIVD